MTYQSNLIFFPGLQQAEVDKVVGPDDAGPELQHDCREGSKRMGRTAGKHLILFTVYYVN